MENLKVSVKDGKTCEKIVSVEVSQENIQKEFNLFYNSIAQKAKIPGFRPGKAPRNVLEIHYQGEAKERVLKNLISESLRSALMEKMLDPLVYPKIDEVDFTDTKLSYKALIEVRPKIKLSKVKGLSAKKEKVEVKAEEIDAELKRVQESFAKFKVVEDRPAQMGDQVITDYVCTIEGKEVDKRSDDWLEIKEDEFVKGLSTGLIGTKPGDEREVKVTFPKDIGREELAGKDAVFNIKVKEIKSKELPELNDELAKDMGEVKTLAELKEKIEKDILAGKSHHAEVQYENALLKELVKHNKIDLPPTLVEKRVDHLVEDSKNQHLKQGLPEESFKAKEEELRKNMQEEAKQQVHLAFLLDEMAVKENVTVTEEDTDKKIQQMADRIRQPIEQIKKFYAENESARGSMTEQIRNEKVIEMIKQSAKQK